MADLQTGVVDWHSVEMDVTREEMWGFVTRHCRKDWGDCTFSECLSNELRLRKRQFVSSRYTTRNGVIIGITTHFEPENWTLIIPLNLHNTYNFGPKRW